VDGRPPQGQTAAVRLHRDERLATRAEQRFRAGTLFAGFRFPSRSSPRLQGRQAAACARRAVAGDDGSRGWKVDQRSNVGEGDAAVDENKPVDDRMLAVQMAQYSKEADETLLNNQVQRLRTDVSYLMARGVQVALFEMPVNPALNSSPQARQIRDRIHAAFP